ncbi:MAG: TusE/DsrC/DsvC family sulfur relay protein [Gammaproteobacteria bacterium]|nr:TusE/DsrC/DsvC family sulfur relay protein [Rhodospirillales bacterium]MCW8919046.1 TusE/DsrC/DsvC family sulfur relay protein [Gammaproteobacteria bacterium]MCW8952563.1 TusE/DsrC/DsvC family sulfur relay protein [Rhodospirillales bacterium]
MELRVDGEGFLLDRDDWNETTAAALAAQDDVDLSDEHLDFIKKARSMYDELGVVPPIRKFAKETGVSTKELYDVFQKGPMKLICKWGGLPKPTGCV